MYSALHKNVTCLKLSRVVLFLERADIVQNCFSLSLLFIERKKHIPRIRYNYQAIQQ